MSRGERRRLEREREKAQRATGVGLRWRYTVGRRRKYQVVEPPERTLEYLEAESEAKGLTREDGAE